MCGGDMEVLSAKNLRVVSSENENGSVPSSRPDGEGVEHLAGTRLIQTVATLSELPEHLAYQELQHILEGQISDDLTLDQLRAAMIAYLNELDQMQASLGSQDLDA